ncbi:MAG: DUF4123 domain-containing protein [Thiomicrorhabdus sp.]|nr:DUF4123 domain-containing protein [Thiomicrorhabdus sp.]
MQSKFLPPPLLNSNTTVAYSSFTPQHIQSLYSRYYDPRVFTRFLPSCQPNQLQTIFGPVKAYLVEDSATDMQRYWVDNQQIKHEPLLSNQINPTPQNTDTSQGSAVC